MAGFLGGFAPVPLDPLRDLPSGVQFSVFASAFMFGQPALPLSQIPFETFVAGAARRQYRRHRLASSRSNRSPRRTH